MPKIVQEIVRENYQDGELIQSEDTKVFNVEQEPAFIKLYLQDVLYMSNMPVTHSALLYELLKNCTYADEGMRIVINGSLKKEIQVKLGFKNVSSINNALTNLRTGKVLERKMPGIYVFNPYLFGKGDWKSIQKLRSTFDYTPESGRTFGQVLVEYKTKAKPTLLSRPLAETKEKTGTDNNIPNQLSFDADDIFSIHQED